MKSTAAAHPVQDVTHTIFSHVSASLPFTGSVGVATHPIKTIATVEFKEKLTERVSQHPISINGVPADQAVCSSMDTVISHIKAMSGIEKSAPYKIVCKDTSPWFRKCSGIAAVTCAAAHAAGLDLSKKELSSIARKGHVYAPHSICGYFSEWKSELQSEFSYSTIIDDELEMGMVAVFTKPVKNMYTITPADEPWLKIEYSNRNEMIQAIKKHDIHLIGLLAEKNSIIHHAYALQSTGGTWQPDTLRVMAEVTALRQEKISAFYSVGNGVVYVNSSPEDVLIIHDRLSSLGLDPVDLSVGKEAHTINGHLF